MMVRVLVLMFLLTAVVVGASAQPAGSKDGAAGRRLHGAVPLLEVVGDDLDFGTVPRGGSQVDSFMVANAGTETLHLTRPYLNGKGRNNFRIIFPVSGVDLPPSRFVRVVVECAPVDSGCFSAGIVLQSDGGADTVRAVNCALDSVPATHYDLLWFGGVPIGRCDDRIVNLFNTGDAPLVITSIEDVPQGGPFFPLTPIPSSGLEIPPHSFVPFSFRFCPSAPGLIAVVAHLLTASDIYEVTLYGTGTTQQIAISTPQIDFGDVPVGQYRDTFFTVSNFTSSPITITAESFDLPVFTAPAFTSPIMILPAETATIPLRFTPALSSVTYVGLDTLAGLGPGYTILLRGRGAPEPLRRVWLDTATARVGEIAALKLRVDPPLTISERVLDVRIRFRFDPAALFLQSVASPAGVVDVDRPADGIVDMRIGTLTGWMEGGELLDLKLIGLATGQPINKVRIDSIDGLPETGEIAVGDGLVMLEGCILGRVPQLGRRIAIQALRLDPGGSVAIDYTAPEGSRGLVRVVSVAGRELLRQSLEGGRGNVRLSLASLPDGLYFVTLDAAGDQSFVPIVLSR